MKGIILIIGENRYNISHMVDKAKELGFSLEIIGNLEKRMKIISEKLYYLSNKNYDVIFTIGGTGIESGDITPEATENVIDKKLPGLEYFIFKETVNTAADGVFSRVVAGMRGKTLIINLPSRGYENVFLKIIEAILKIKKEKD